MKTGSTKMRFQTKRLVVSSDLENRLAAYYETGAQTLGSKVFDQGSVFGSLSLVSGGPDEISVTGSALATDGLGFFLDIAQCVNADPVVNFMTDVRFVNALATTYYVGLRRCQIPSGVQTNPRFANAEITGMTDFIGESGAPSGVIDNGNGTMRIRFMAQVGNLNAAGRRAYIWLNTPATDTSQYLYFGTVQWSGVFNYVDVPHVFGQSSVSTTAADYTVVIPGPTIFSTSLIGVSGYVFLGTVVGAGAGNPPVTFDTSGQVAVDFSLSGLNSQLDDYSENIAVVTATSPAVSAAGYSAILPNGERANLATFTYNDQIYIVGGINDSNVSSSDVYSYSTTTDGWTVKASVPTQGGVTGALHSYGVALVGTKAYVLGGRNEVGVTAAAKTRIYDAATNTWTAGADMTAARYDGMVGAIGTKVYYAGGKDSADVAQSTLYEYDTITNTWSTKAALPFGIYGAACAVLNGKFYVIGGYNGGGFSIDEVRYYDQNANAWVDVTYLEEAAGNIAAAAYDGHIHVICGNSTPEFFHYVYSDTLDLWSTIDSDFNGRVDDPVPAACGFNSHALGVNSHGCRILGGRIQAAQTIGVLTTCDYNIGVDLRGFKIAEGPGVITSAGIPSALTVGSAATLETYPEALCGAHAVRVGRFVYLIGGDVVMNSTASVKCWRWSADTQTFQRLADLPTARAGCGLVYHPQEHAIYALGGRTAAATAAVGVNRYDIATDTWSTPNTALDRMGFGQAWLVGDKIWMFGGLSGGADTAGTTITYYDIRKRTATNSATVLPSSRRNALTFAVPTAGQWGPNSHPGATSVFIMGGDAGGSVTTSIYIFDTAAQTIVTLTPVLSTARGYAHCVPIEGYPGKVAIIGGVATTSSATTRVDVFDIGDLSLTQVATMPSARLNCGGAEIDGIFYAFAGASGTSGARTAQSSTYGFKGSYAGRLRIPIQNYTSQCKSSSSIAFDDGHLHGWHSWARGVYQNMVRSGNR